jgi:hypothetical protein
MGTGSSRIPSDYQDDTAEGAFATQAVVSGHFTARERCGRIDFLARPGWDDEQQLLIYWARGMRTIPIHLIAPCGMNCRLCMAHQREKNHCPGCRVKHRDESEYRLNCIIRNCDFFVSGKAKYCFACEKHPCRRLKQLDKRYRNRYHMSMLENLATIRDLGVRAFIKREKEKWTCPTCSNLVSVHRPHCLSCGDGWTP